MLSKLAFGFAALCTLTASSAFAEERVDFKSAEALYSQLGKLDAGTNYLSSSTALGAQNIECTMKPLLNEFGKATLQMEYTCDITGVEEAPAKLIEGDSAKQLFEALQVGGVIPSFRDQLVIVKATNVQCDVGPGFATVEIGNEVQCSYERQ